MKWFLYKAAVGVSALALCGGAFAQQHKAEGKAAAKRPNTTAPTPEDAGVTHEGEPLDRVVAIVNNDLVLESDVNEEMRLDQWQPFQGVPGETARERAITRLVDRSLILQQEKIQPQAAISDAEVNAELMELRKQIPACTRYKCTTAEGWHKFLADNGFTEAEIVEHWRVRMSVLRFIEMRFRAGQRISQGEVKDYYEKTMLPVYAREKVKPPALDSIQQRIEEVLLQQKVSSLLDEWLKALRAQGTVRVLKPGEEAP